MTAAVRGVGDATPAAGELSPDVPPRAHLFVLIRQPHGPLTITPVSTAHAGDGE